MTAQPPFRRTLLPHYLALLYGLSIVFASLQPFSPWVAPPPGTPFFLAEPRLTGWTRFDIVLNVVAYVPFGLFIAFAPERASFSARLALALAGGACMSFAMEWAQMYLPQRDASVIDLVSNTAGAVLGGAAGAMLSRSERATHAILKTRQQWFLEGKTGDMGIALVAVWLVVQVNPSIPLFALMFDPGFQGGPNPNPNANDLVTILVESTGSAFQLLGVGLFLALLVRERRFVGGALLMLIGAALLVKGLAAATLLKPAIWERWLSPGVSTGVAAGALLLLAAVWLPRPVQVALAAIALLSSLLIMMIAPDLLFTRPPLSAFNWSYGQLLNFNGLTHTVLLVWPVVASGYLFALAGRPRWGAPG